MSETFFGATVGGVKKEGIKMKKIFTVRQQNTTSKLFCNVLTHFNHILMKFVSILNVSGCIIILLAKHLGRLPFQKKIIYENI